MNERLLLTYEPVRAGRYSSLVAYRLEWRRWPREQALRVAWEQVRALYDHLTAALALDPVKSVFKTGDDSGRYNARFAPTFRGPRRTSRAKTITLRGRGGTFCYGVAVHEFAHHLAQFRRRGGYPQHNSRVFTDALERTYMAANAYMTGRTV